MYTKLLQINLAKILQAIETVGEQSSSRWIKVRSNGMFMFLVQTHMLEMCRTGMERIRGIQKLILVGHFEDGTNFSPWLPALFCGLLWNIIVGETHGDLKDVESCLWGTPGRPLIWVKPWPLQELLDWTELLPVSIKDVSSEKHNYETIYSDKVIKCIQNIIKWELTNPYNIQSEDNLLFQLAEGPLLLHSVKTLAEFHCEESPWSSNFLWYFCNYCPVGGKKKKKKNSQLSESKSFKLNLKVIYHANTHNTK